MTTYSRTKLKDGSSWPSLEHLDDLGWKMRYAETTLSDRLVAAGVIEAYKELILATQKRRNRICKELQKPVGILIVDNKL